MNRRGANAYILLEVILAVAIVGISLGVLMDGMGRCLAAARSVQSYNLAQILLTNKSCEFRLEHTPSTINQEGDFTEHPGFAWRRELTPTQTVGLWEQTITVTWQERGRTASDSIVEYRYLPQKQR